MEFSGKNILVVGASSGIGLQLAKDLAEKGANLYTASRSNPEISVNHITLDVLSMTGDELKALPNELHGLAYCPGSINLKPFQRLKPEDFLQDFQINLLGAVKVIQAVIAKLKKAGSSSVLLYSTVAVQSGMGFHASIASAKGAVEGLTRSLAAEFAASKIRVNAIAPSLTDTPLAGNLLADEKRRDASAKRHPLGRVGTVRDMASVSVLLLSEEASWMTGQIIGVDGGLSSVRPL